MAQINITLFGGFEVRRARDESIAIDSRKARALLAFLAHQPGRQSSREEVCGLLWGDRSELQARGSLRQLLTDLRHTLSDISGSPLLTSRESIGLDASAVTVDVHEFEENVRLATPETLEQAIRLYRGSFLAGFELREAGFTEWARDERHRLHNVARKACRSILHHLERQEQVPHAIELGERLIALDGCDEEGHRALMRLHAAEGNIGLALQQYQTCRELLQEELGIAPSTETERLFRELRGGGPRTPAGGDMPKSCDHSAPPIHLSAGPSLAVLPFENLSGDPAQEFFADGITEDIITELSRFRPLFVRVSGSSFRHRHERDPSQLARDLGVQYVVEGSVRRVGDCTRVAAKLVDLQLGRHLWAERFDRDQHDIFAIQDEVVATIVGTLVGRLDAAGAEQASRKPPASLAAYECVLRGSALPIGDLDAEAEARALYEKAIELDPEYGRAHAKLAYLLSQEWFRDMGGADAVLERAIELGKRAVRLDNGDSFCHDILGWLYLLDRCFEVAEHHKRRALELTPNSPEQVACMGVLTSFLGKPDEAISWFEQARRLDPYFEPAWYWRMQGIAHFVGRRHDDAISCFGRSPTSPLWVDAYLAACHALGGGGSSDELAAKVLSRDPRFSAVRLVTKEPYRRETDANHLLEGLRRAGLPE